ncbi:MAG: phage replisome organizer N-terminal domain-containing protein [Petrotogaceae bacterium]|nr:phage replisome organizer N-terminal domain-containing protein [Petrotogaceae bacterium]
MVSWIKLSVNIFEDEKVQIIESIPEGDQMILM